MWVLEESERRGGVRADLCWWRSVLCVPCVEGRVICMYAGGGDRVEARVSLL